MLIEKQYFRILIFWQNIKTLKSCFSINLLDFSTATPPELLYFYSLLIDLSNSAHIIDLDRETLLLTRCILGKNIPSLKGVSLSSSMIRALHHHHLLLKNSISFLWMYKMDLELEGRLRNNTS
jgi:hypothetical protein